MKTPEVNLEQFIKGINEAIEAMKKAKFTDEQRRMYHQRMKDLIDKEMGAENEKSP